MKILHTLPRHARSLEVLQRVTSRPQMSTCKYVVVAIDGPESLNRQASWASDFTPDDTAKIFQALAEQTKA